MSEEETPMGRMENIKRELFKDKNVKYFLYDVKISNIENKNEEDSDFVGKVREKIINMLIPEDKNKLEEFMNKTLEIRKIFAIFHTIMDLLLYFSDYFPNSANVEGEHKERVEKYKNLLKLKEGINDAYIEKLKKFIGAEESKVIIIVPLFPNVSLQSFSILSELRWLKELIIDEETESLRENIEIHLLYLNKPFLDTLKQENEEKQKYFGDYKTGQKIMVKSVLDLNKLRLESFVKRYLTEYIRKELKEKGKNVRIAYWLEKHVKTVDEKVGEFTLWNKEKIKIDGIKCDEATSKNISSKKKSTEAQKCYYLSDVGVPELLGFSPQDEKEAAYKDILYYLEKKIEPESVILFVQSSRALVLYNFYIDEIKKGKKIFLGWDSYIPMTKPPIIPIFQYLSTFSKSYNFSLAEMYKEIVYNCKERGEKYTICYLAHFLEFLFDDVLKTFGLSVKGPKCKECESDTIVVKEECDRLNESGRCGTTHWVFECTSHWEKHAPCGTVTDYLWLPMEIYSALEKIFLDIPYTLMLTKREYRFISGKGQSTDIEEREMEKEFEKFISFNVEDIKKHFEKQGDYLRELLESKSK